MPDENKYTLELDWPEEVGVIVEALRVQRERWQDALMKKLANDPSVSAIPLEQIQQGIERHAASSAAAPSPRSSVSLV
jgi:hypothetical protein